MFRTQNQTTYTRLIGRWTLAPLVGVVVGICASSAALAVSEEDLPSGRLGYTWVPDPPKAAPAGTEETALQIAKYGGAGLLVLWLFRRMVATE
jgi:hypothetical protein